MVMAEKLVSVVTVRKFYDGFGLHQIGKQLELAESVVFKKDKDGKFITDRDGNKIMCACFKSPDQVQEKKPMPGPKAKPVQHAVQKTSDVI
jgi:hypothetical protein